jgi:hypothetical protein
MGVEVSEPREAQETETGRTARKQSGDGAKPPAAPEARPGLVARLRNELDTGLRELRWGDVLLFGLIAGALMSLSFVSGGALQIIAGLVPVGTGLLLGRRIKAHYILHGLMTGLVGAAVGMLSLGVLFFLTPLGTTIQQAASSGAATTFTPLQAWAQFSLFTAFSLIIFCTFGTSMAARTEERNRKLREEVDTRGGKLERPGVIRSADDIRGLSLPQFGSYVSSAFKKQGFQFKDYKFIDKDKHLDIWMEHEGEPWHLRLSVADKVTPGTVESLLQEMKREGCRKGVVLASTEFLPSTLKSAKNRPVVLIDGPTLYEIAEK